jgi:hypothetical protein
MPAFRNPASDVPTGPGLQRGSRVALVGVAISTLLAACGSDGFGPVTEHLDASYALESVNGAPIPATAAEGGGQRYILLADTLRFSRDGVVERSVVFRHLSTTFSPSDSVYRVNGTFRYTVRTGHLTVGNTKPCPPNANCIGFEEGIITPSEAIVRARLYWSGEPVLRFRRLRQ